MFNNPLIRSIATSSDEHSLRLSERDWPLVLNANRAFEEPSEQWRGDSVWGQYLLDRIGPKAHRLDFSSSLELCCGNGFLFFSFRDLVGLGADSDFIDLSGAQLDAFRQRCRHAGVAPPKLHSGDIGNLPFADGCKQLVYGHSFLHHLPDVARYLREVARVLKPGGYFVDFHEPTPTAPLLETFPRPLLRNVTIDSLTDIWLITPQVITRLLREAGFSKVDVIPNGLLGSLLVAPLQMLLAKLHREYQARWLVKLRWACNRGDRMLPLRMRLSYSPSIALVAQKQAEEPGETRTPIA